MTHQAIHMAAIFIKSKDPNYIFFKKRIKID